MAERVYMSTTGSGVARASCLGAGKHEIETLLSEVEVKCLSADRLERVRVYAGTRGEGVLRSDDRGKTWRPAGLAGRVVTAVSTSPSQQDVVYAGTKPAHLFVSRNAGATWHELPAFRRIPGRRLWFSPAEKPFIGYVQAIALSPQDPNRIVVGIESGATVMSSDGGETWSRHLRGSLRDCHGLVFHPVDGDWVYEAGGTGGGATFSRDAGSTWVQAGRDLDRHYGWAVAGDPDRPSTWYVSVSPSPCKAHGGQSAEAYVCKYDGAAWQRLAGGLPQPLAHMPYAIVADPDIPGDLCVGLSNGDLWHSCDHGENWEKLPVELPGIRRSLVIL